MMRGWALSGLVAGAALALLLHAPAVWLATALHAASGGLWQLQEARGSVWNGSARLQVGEAAPGSGPVLLPGRLQWSGSIDKEGLRLALRAECCAAQPQLLRLRPGWRRLVLQLADGQTRWPAFLLGGLGVPWNTVLPEGELHLRSQGVSVEWSADGTRLGGRIELDALAMASRLSTLRPVGSYRLVLDATAAGTAPGAFRLQTLEGPLRLEGEGQWGGSGLRLRGVASAEPDSEAALQNLLNMLGRRQGSQALLAWG